MAPQAQFIATLPLGQNAELDGLLEKNEIPFVQQFYLKRVTSDNVWIETEWRDIRGAKNHFPFRAANGLVIGLF
ncbi:MAG TPA: hypothetical protein VLX29_06975 [Nitrospirota bacterium]|nr:hypothetical protein [Nitrospirota bacterium]